MIDVHLVHAHNVGATGEGVLDLLALQLLDALPRIAVHSARPSVAHHLLAFFVLVLHKYVSEILIELNPIILS